jgi:hypothetical protein
MPWNECPRSRGTAAHLPWNAHYAVLVGRGRPATRSDFSLTTLSLDCVVAELDSMFQNAPPPSQLEMLRNNRFSKYRISSLSACADMAEDTDLLTFAPASAVANLVADRALARAPLPSPALLSICAVARADAMLAPHVRSFIAAVGSACARALRRRSTSLTCCILICFPRMSPSVKGTTMPEDLRPPLKGGRTQIGIPGRTHVGIGGQTIPESAPSRAGARWPTFGTAAIQAWRSISRCDHQSTPTAAPCDAQAHRPPERPPAPTFSGRRVIAAALSRDFKRDDLR